jgi:mRNA (guanine-N7-)-methyltransferase
VFNIRFEDKEHLPPFGAKYYFTLEEAVNNVPEYLVHIPTFAKCVYVIVIFNCYFFFSVLFIFIYFYCYPYFAYYLGSLAAEYGLKLEYQAGFHQFYQEHSRDRKHLRLLNRMRCLDETGHLEKENWEVSAVYMAFIFRKEGEPRPRSVPLPARHHGRGGSPTVIDLISKELKMEQG